MGFRVTHQHCGSSLPITYNSVVYDFFFQMSTSARPEYPIAVLMLCAKIPRDLADAFVIQVLWRRGKLSRYFENCQDILMKSFLLNSRLLSKFNIELDR